MSRIGKMPIAIPAGVTVEVASDNTVTVKGPLGTLVDKFNPEISIKVEGEIINVTRNSEEKEIRSLHGLTRSLVNNMVVGVSEGYKKVLEIVGVGYKAVKTGKTIQLFLGHSLMPNGLPQDKFIIEEPEGITFEVTEKTVPITITVKGIDKQAVGHVAATIREKRPPEPYHGKGIKYKGEQIRRKAGKSGKK